MKKIFKTLLITACLFSVMSFTAFADMGSKPRVAIKIINQPDEEYYADLLYQPANPDRLYENIDGSNEYDPDMLQLLFSYKNEGWHPAYAGGTGVPMWGNIIPDESNNVVFSYHGVPDSFKIIIATRSGEVKTTDIIHRKAMEANLTLDYESMSYTSKPLWQVYLGQFALTCSVTIIVELIILILFGFKIKENIKIFVCTNLLTQIVFTVMFSYSFIYGGTMGSMFAFIPLEAGVTIAEMLIYRKLLKGHTDKRRIIYAVTANITTAGLTWVNIDWLMDIMFQLMR